jgi:hypothetical protein
MKGETVDQYVAVVCCGDLCAPKHYPAPKTATVVNPENPADDKSTPGTNTDTDLNVRPEDLPTNETPVDSNDNAGQDSGGCGYD